MTDFDLDRPWRVGPGVALRPERFGALAYSFDTRRLSFLKSRRLFEVVRTLAEHPERPGGVRGRRSRRAELAQPSAALGTLAATGMIEERSRR